MEDSVLTGSDEEQAMVIGEGIEIRLSPITALYCMIHYKDDVCHYMTKIGVALSHREKILAMIFRVNGATLSGDEA